MKPLIWKHQKRGGLYAIVAQAELQSSGGPVLEGAELTVYVGIDDGKQWARPRAEFEDGRFVPLENTTQEHVEALAQFLVHAANAAGMVVSIEQRPLQPLAMRNYETIVSVRPARA